MTDFVTFGIVSYYDPIKRMTVRVEDVLAIQFGAEIAVIILRDHSTAYTVSPETAADILKLMGQVE